MSRKKMMRSQLPTLRDRYWQVNGSGTIAITPAGIPAGLPADFSIKYTAATAVTTGYLAIELPADIGGIVVLADVDHDNDPGTPVEAEVPTEYRF